MKMFHVCGDGVLARTPNGAIGGCALTLSGGTANFADGAKGMGMTVARDR